MWGAYDEVRGGIGMWLEHGYESEDLKVIGDAEKLRNHGEG